MRPRGFLRHSCLYDFVVWHRDKWLGNRRKIILLLYFAAVKFMKQRYTYRRNGFYTWGKMKVFCLPSILGQLFGTRQRCTENVTAFTTLASSYFWTLFHLTSRGTKVTCRDTVKIYLFVLLLVITKLI